MSSTGSEDSDTTVETTPTERLASTAAAVRSAMSKRNWLLVMCMALIAIGVPPFVSLMMSDPHQQEVDQVKGVYEAMHDQCLTLAGSDRELCDAAANVTRVRAMSRIDLLENGSPKAQEDAGNRVARAEYLLARVRCKLLDGEAGTACFMEAQAELAWRRAANKAMRVEAREAMRDQNQKNVDRYWMAVAKCDSESGRVKNDCLTQAKIKYHQ
jgi:hypothetical protein